MSIRGSVSRGLIVSNNRLYRLIARAFGKVRVLPRPPNAAEIQRGCPMPVAGVPEQPAPASTIPDSYLSIYSVSPELFATGRVPLRVVGPHGRILTLETLITYVGHATFEIRVSGTVIGFIRRTDRTFAARAVQRMGQPLDCPQCLLWDEAARELVRAAGIFRHADARMRDPQPVPA